MRDFPAKPASQRYPRDGRPQEHDEFHHHRRRRTGLRRASARRRVRQAVSDHRLRPVRRPRSPPTAAASIRRAKSAATSLRPPTGLEVTTDPAALRRRTSSSSPCRRRSTTRTSPISGRCSARANRSAGTSKRGAIVVFESTVYPGATEEICVPVLEKHSGMQWKRDFFVGYSPERINPGRQGAHAHPDHQGRRPATRRRRSSASPSLYGSVVNGGRAPRLARSRSPRRPR